MKPERGCDARLGKGCDLKEKKGQITIAKESYDAVIFDLDGVITKTAKVHAAAWKKLFDAYLKQVSEREGTDFKPFDIDGDYREYVDGKPRNDGVNSFLESRGLELPYGSPDDSPGKETICGLGNRKNQFFHEQLEKNGVEVYEGAEELLHQLRDHGFQTAIVSSSKNCAAVLKTAGLTDLFDERVDGMISEEVGLKGKPEPDIFLEAAKRLGVDPSRAVVMEDALAGVQAGRKGNFGLVVGVDRTGHAEELKNNGADAVVADLGTIKVAPTAANGDGIPPALDRTGEISRELAGKKVAVFLDYDGTLTPIVDRPEEARLSAEMRQTVKTLARHCTVAVISGRDLKDVQDLVGLEEIYYAGSHGFDIAGPEGKKLEHQAGTEFLPVLAQAEKALRDRLDQNIPGVQVERKKFSIAVHYRRVSEDRIQEIEAVVDQVLEENSRLRKGSGKKIFELQPDIDWNKGKALLWLLSKLELDREDVLPLYIGDDVTDEYAFEVLRNRGLGIVVQEGGKSSAARYRLRNPGEVEEFLRSLIKVCKGGRQ